MTSSAISPIETTYRGYRFRSRLEARTAVFFDAAGIEWEYEVEGYRVGRGGYLPDFWLPRLKMFVDVKPTIEAARAAEPTMRELVIGTGHRGLFIAGSFSVESSPELLLIKRGDDSKVPTFTTQSWWWQCPYCDAVGLVHDHMRCSCIPATVTVTKPTSIESLPRIKHAIQQAQRARFEHGEGGRPAPYKRPARPLCRVYVAGSVIENRIDPRDAVATDARLVSTITAWREGLAARSFDSNWPKTADRCGRFWYAGPSILNQHGIGEEGLANECLEQVGDADALFVWIDRRDTVGTVAEVGAAYALDKPIFAAFASKALSNEFYFVAQLASMAVIADDAESAWSFFMQWMDRVAVTV